MNIDANHDDDEAGPTEIDGLFWYVADTTPMHDYLNTHAALEARRARCGSNGAPGPKVHYTRWWRW